MKPGAGLRAALTPLTATLVTGAVAFVSFIVAGATGLAGVIVPLAAGLGAGILVSLFLGHRQAAVNRSLEEILAAADKDVIDLAALLPDNGGAMVAGRNGPIDSLLSIAAKLNINLAISREVKCLISIRT